MVCCWNPGLCAGGDLTRKRSRLSSAQMDAKRMPACTKDTSSDEHPDLRPLRPGSQPPCWETFVAQDAASGEQALVVGTFET